MARDDTFKRYEEAGAEFVEVARSRAAEFLKDLSFLGESTQRQAGSQAGDLVDAGRRGTDQILEMIRREIRSQLSQLGLATHADLEALEARLAGSASSGTPRRGAKPGPATRSTGPVKRPTPKSTATAAAKAPANRKATAAKEGTGSKKSTAGKKAAPVTRTSAARAAGSRAPGAAKTASPGAKRGGTGGRT